VNVRRSGFPTFPEDAQNRELQFSQILDDRHALKLQMSLNRAREAICLGRSPSQAADNEALLPQCLQRIYEDCALSRDE
jgi:hypothetical protein